MVSNLASLFASLDGFEGDAGNTAKNVLGHDVSQAEAESLFFNVPVMVLDDDKHSAAEQRFLIHGVTADGRRLTAVFTIRGNLVRVISVRDMSRRERLAYESAR